MTKGWSVVIYVLVSSLAFFFIYHGGMGGILCKNEHERMTEMDEEQEQYCLSHIVVVTTASSEDMESLREFIGSMHTLRHSQLDVHLIMVYGFGLTLRNKREIALWRNVELVDGDEVFFMSQRTVSLDAQVKYVSGAKWRLTPKIILSILELNLRKHQQVIYIRSDYVFTRDSIHDIVAEINANGFFISTEKDTTTTTTATTTTATANGTDGSSEVIMGFNAGTRQASLFVSLVLQCMRGYHCDGWFYTQLVSEQNEQLKRHHHDAEDFGVVKYNQEPKHYCYLLLRDDVLYSTESMDTTNDGNEIMEDWEDYAPPVYESPLDPFPLPKSGKIPIAIGMPTISVDSLSSYEEVSPLRIFFPSLLKTITLLEWVNHEYWVYIGFDEGDRYFDNAKVRQKINEKINQMVKEHGAAPSMRNIIMDIRVEYVKFPYSRGWVTYLWNGLFIQAMRDGAHYFYQVNDDLELLSPRWSTFFVSTLTANDQFGVAGPWDKLHEGRLLTQAMVSRKHYFIFGKLYPLDIKDWYSDSWLDLVYGAENRFSIKAISADNKNDKGTRYAICSQQPHFEALLRAGKRLIQDWKEDVQAIVDLTQENTQDSSVNGSTGHHRLDLELAHGPILNK